MQAGWRPDIRPAMITDDIAFVGGGPVSVHCLMGEDGLILLDAGYPSMLEGICENLRALGLDVRDVKYILHTHGHIDHYGCTAQLVRRSGAKTLLGREDADIVTGRVDLSWAKELGLEAAETFVPDVLFKDGDVLDLCGRRIRCIHAPGHTAGTYAFLIDTKVDGVPMTAAMHGGVGLNSMGRGFLEGYGLSLDCREAFRAGLHRLLDEPVDVVLGNHPNQNDTAGRIARLGTGVHPFVDPDQWRRFLTDCEAQLDRMLAEEAKHYNGGNSHEPI